MSQVLHANTGGPGGGFLPTRVTEQFTNLSGGDLVAGDVVMLNRAAAGTPTPTTGLPGAEGVSTYNTFVAVTAAGTKSGTILVLLEDIADGEAGECGMYGIFPVLVNAAGAAGADLSAQAASQALDTTPTTADRIVGYLCNAAGAGGIVDVEFNGLTGYGTA